MDKSLLIKFKDYQPESFGGAFQRESNGWISQEDAEDLLLSAFRHVGRNLQPGDKLEISLTVSSNAH